MEGGGTFTSKSQIESGWIVVDYVFDAYRGRVAHVAEGSFLDEIKFMNLAIHTTVLAVYD